MNKKFFVFLLAAIAIAVKGQNFPDSLMKEYKLQKTTTQKLEILYQYARKLSGTPEQKITTLIKQLHRFENDRDETDLANFQLLIANQTSVLGEYPTSLKYAIAALKTFEEKMDTTGVLKALIIIGGNFFDSYDLEESLTYYKKGLPISKPYNDRALYGMFLNGTAAAFNRLNLPDSALAYIQEAVRVDHALKDTIALAASINTLGETYMAKKEHDIALPFLKQSIQYARISGAKYYLAYNLTSLSQSFFETKKFDSALVYGRQALSIAYPNFKSTILKSYELLYKIFEKTGQQDSINKYFRLAMTTKDSIYSLEKTRSMHFINFQEQIRQQENELSERKSEVVRLQNIQYALIGLGIVILFILFLLLSRRIITNPTVIKYLGVIALLIVFEFFNLLLHPFLEKITHHSPILMLLALVCIAAILVPIHHALEKWTTQTLIEKNKQIRLAAARKTIQRLEGQ